LVLFRVVQEALTNVSRHSRSPRAAIRLTREPTADGQNVVLTIEDSGVGMSQARGIRLIGRAGAGIKRGVGLASMRERLHQIGGQLEIDSAPGLTTVKAIVPIRDHGSA
jgi:two-component system NarL family sensor kinase